MGEGDKPKVRNVIAICAVVVAAFIGGAVFSGGEEKASKSGDAALVQGNVPGNVQGKTLAEQEQEQEKKIQHFVDRIAFTGVSEDKRPPIRVAIAALFKACPRILDSITFDDRISIDYYDDGYDGWWGSDALVRVRLFLDQNHLANVPANIHKDVMPEFGLRGGSEPGVLLLKEFPRWLCDMEIILSDDEIIRRNENHIPLRDMIQFIPLDTIPPNSF